MRTLIWVPLAAWIVLAGACKKSPSLGSGPPLLLVEAGLASRLLSGKLDPRAFCDQQIPYLERRGAHIELQCAQGKDRLEIDEEKTDGARTVLRLKQGGSIEVEQIGRDRYRVRGNPCDPSARVYVVFADAKVYRQRWLKTARCPTQDMKLAN